MRWTILALAALAAFAGSRPARADIYTWVDRSGVTHFSNQAPPPEAEVLMVTQEIPYDEAADRARQQAEQRQALHRAQAELRELEARLAEVQAAAERRMAAAEQLAEEARRLPAAESAPAKEAGYRRVYIHRPGQPRYHPGRPPRPYYRSQHGSIHYYRDFDRRHKYRRGDRRLRSDPGDGLRDHIRTPGRSDRENARFENRRRHPGHHRRPSAGHTRPGGERGNRRR